PTRISYLLPHARSCATQLPYTTLFRSLADLEAEAEKAKENGEFDDPANKLHAFVKLQRMRQIINSPAQAGIGGPNPKVRSAVDRSEEHTSELQSRENLVCRLLLEKKKT